MKYQVTATMDKQEIRFYLRVPTGPKELKEARDVAAEIIDDNFGVTIAKLDAFKLHQVDKEGQAAADPKQPDLPGAGGERRARGTPRDRALVPAKPGRRTRAGATA